jgi:hypothetical protein
MCKPNIFPSIQGIQDNQFNSKQGIILTEKALYFLDKSQVLNIVELL